MREYRRQEPPNAVQIELVEGCNLYCDFCGLRGIREQKHKNLKFMAPEVLESCVRQMVDARWNPRIEFAMHGEPTLHEAVAGMVMTVRNLAPRWYIMMTSNGGGLLRNHAGIADKIEGLFEFGLNTLALDEYEGIKIVPKIREAMRGSEIPQYEYPENPNGNPHARHRDRKLVYVRDISKAEKGTHSTLNNHAGSGSPRNQSGWGKRCAKPFREMSIRWDGSVAVCCNDWRGTYRCGNVASDGLDAVWNGDAMGAARRALYHGHRKMLSPCAGCDATSYRVGLLPDKLGKEKLPEPDGQDQAVMARAASGDSLTAPVWREWE